MKKNVIAVISWIITIWICKVFLLSLPYKFSGHPDTQHIFGTIGDWMGGILGQTIGNLFSNVGAIGVGVAELITSLILLAPALIFILTKIGASSAKNYRSKFHRIGGGLASMIMSGAVFFHLFTPLGIEVLHQGKSDGGSLFYAAASILILGIVMVVINSLKVEDTH